MDPGPILRQIESLGYQMHASKAGDPPKIHVAGVEGEGEGPDYRCACELALLVGIDLEDG